VTADLYLFAHPDDEFGVCGTLEAGCRGGRRAICAYLTDGGADHRLRDRRAQESRRVLRRLGVADADIHFPGIDEHFADGALHRAAAPALRAVERLIAAAGPLGAVYLPAWEGGHQDHDCAHAIGLLAGTRAGAKSRVRQFSLYHGAGLRGRWFRVMTPLPANGPAEVLRLTVEQRLRYAALCLSYPSQWRSWIGLFPFAAKRLLIDGWQGLQPVRMARLFQRPHEGALLYERRTEVRFGEVSAALAEVLGPG